MPSSIAGRLGLTVLAVVALLVGCAAEQSVDPRSVSRPSAALVSAPPIVSPANATATAVSDSRIEVVWLDKSNNETGFEIHRSLSGAFGTFTLRNVTAANATSYQDSAHVAATLYCYQLRAFRQSGNRKSYSAFSRPACATTAAPPPPPPPPPPPIPAAASGVHAVATGSTSVSVGWVDNFTSQSGFRVYWSADGGSTWVLAFTETGWNRSVIVYGESERLNCYRVVAFNVTGESAPANRHRRIQHARRHQLHRRIRP